MYSRYYRIDAWDSDRETNKLSAREFRDWSDIASNLRLAYKEGHITGEQMIEALSKSTEHEKNDKRGCRRMKFFDPQTLIIKNPRLFNIYKNVEHRII